MLARNNLPDLVDQMNTEIKNLAKRFRANKMAVNIGKPNFLYSNTNPKKLTLLENISSSTKIKLANGLTLISSYRVERMNILVQRP